MSRFTLNDLENLTGIRTDTIRIWERRYNILHPNRTATNRRWYDDNDLKKLINISILYKKGVKISRIAEMSSDEIARRAGSVSELSGNSSDLINSLTLALNDLDEALLNDLILKSVVNTGFEKTFTEVLFPFLKKLGILWHTGAIDPAFEHFVTALIRQKLIAASDSITGKRENPGRKVLMFLPEGEFHELGLLFYAYLLQKKNFRVLYLGQSLPFESLESISGKWNPEILVTGAQSDMAIGSPEKYLEKLGEKFKDKLILAGGILSECAGQLKKENLIPLNNETDLEAL